MAKNKNILFGFFVLFLIPGLFLMGCETMNKGMAIKKREILEEKRKNYETLQETISSQMLHAGISSTKIKETFGDPDDIFSSGSTTGRFEIWSYEEYTPAGKPTWHSIRLYFNNGKLVSWNY